jgi:hypothetical protein
MRHDVRLLRVALDAIRDASTGAMFCYVRLVPADASKLYLSDRMTERDELIQQRGRALVELVAKQLPREVEISPEDFWASVSLGLLSRMAGTLSSIIGLQPGGRRADAAILGRSLYEHAVHFAWLAADAGTARLQEWRKYDLQQRLKADSEMMRFAAGFYTSEQRAYVESQVASLSGRDLHLAQLAIAADECWIARTPGLVAGTTKSFAGLYASLYRHASGTAHPTALGLDRVTDDLSATRRRIRLETAEPGGPDPYGMATIVFGVVLQVSSQALGWPSEAEIEEIFERYPS